MGRILGVDLGKKRIGLALSDPLRLIAQPFRTLGVSSQKENLAEIIGIIREKEVDLVVVGLPLHADGRESPGSLEARAFAKTLEHEGVAVRLFDERDSSVQAREVLAAHGKRARENRESVDRLAAAIIVKEYLSQAAE